MRKLLLTFSRRSSRSDVPGAVVKDRNFTRDVPSSHYIDVPASFYRVRGEKEQRISPFSRKEEKHVWNVSRTAIERHIIYIYDWRIALIEDGTDGTSENGYCALM